MLLMGFVCQCFFAVDSLVVFKFYSHYMLNVYERFCLLSSVSVVQTHDEVYFDAVPINVI